MLGSGSLASKLALNTMLTTTGGGISIVSSALVAASFCFLTTVLRFVTAKLDLRRSIQASQKLTASLFRA